MTGDAMTRVVVVRVDDATPSDARDALRADLRRLDDAALATTETRYVDDADEGDADGFIGAPRVGASAARMCERASAVLRAGGTCALRLGAEARDAMILGVRERDVGRGERCRARGEAVVGAWDGVRAEDAGGAGERDG